LTKKFVLAPNAQLREELHKAIALVDSEFVVSVSHFLKYHYFSLDVSVVVDTSGFYNYWTTKPEYKTIIVASLTITDDQA